MAGPLLYDRVRETSTTTGTGTVTLGGAVPGYQTFAAVGNANTCYYCIAHRAASEWEVGVGTYTSSGTTLSRDKVLASSNSGSAVNFSSGAKDVFLTAPASILEVDPGLCEGRLTLTSGTAITSSDVTGAGTLYFTPYHGNRISLWNGSSWVVHRFSEVSLSLSVTSAKNYDVFLYDNAGTLTLELGNLWTGDTFRNDLLTTQDGVTVKSSATTRRWLGTIRASGTNTTEDSRSKRFVWNAAPRSRVRRPLLRQATGDDWTYSTATWRQAAGVAANQVEVVTGEAGHPVSLHLCGFVQNTAAAGGASLGIGEDSTTSPHADCIGQRVTFIVANDYLFAWSALNATPSAAGYHYYAWLEYGRGSGTQTWAGDNGLGNGLFQAGLTGFVEA